jgi:hypothetical protein
MYHNFLIFFPDTILLLRQRTVIPMTSQRNVEAQSSAQRSRLRGRERSSASCRREWLKSTPLDLSRGVIFVISIVRDHCENHDGWSR